MNFFDRLNIAQRLSWLQILVGGGLLLIALMFISVNFLQSNLSADVARINQFLIGAEEANSGLLQGRRHEKDFIMRGDEKYLAEHEQQMLELSQTLQTVREISADKQARQLVESSSQLADIYQKSFKQLAQVKINLGLDEQSGLRGAMRQSVHSVEKSLNELEQLALGYSMLMMRRHEKDFIARGDDKYLKQMAAEYQTFTRLLSDSPIDNRSRAKIAQLMESYQRDFNAYAEGTKQVAQSLAELRSAAHQAEPLFEQMVELAQQTQQQEVASAETQQTVLTIVFFAVLLLVAAVAAWILLRVSRGITGSLDALGGTVKQLADGDYSARTKLETLDEIGDFSRAFDKLLDERVATLAQAERENEQLNNSVIELMEAVAQLSDKDLTVRVKVAEDVTGPVADSLNLMAEETAEVLERIRAISESVEQAAQSVQEQGLRVSQVADAERAVVEHTMGRLEESSSTMSNIAKVAQSCNAIAGKAARLTDEALQSVTNTQGGMGEIRSTISETEKRIKRLGERSQEITGIVEIINSISERTHVLALNASMQAAAAGDAGRGFAVVADEVQRLAESSRQSTAEITALINNIQAETAEAMATMNSTIEQVVQGSELARSSAEQMLATQKTAEELTQAVSQIARHSTHQARANQELLSEAAKIVESTQQTGSELTAQSSQTNDLVGYSQQLIDSVRVFKLA